MESENAVIAKVSQSNYVSFLNSAGTFSYGLGLGVVLASLLSEGLAIIPTMLVTLGSFLFVWAMSSDGTRDNMGKLT